MQQESGAGESGAGELGPDSQGLTAAEASEATPGLVFDWELENDQAAPSHDQVRKYVQAGWLSSTHFT